MELEETFCPRHPCGDLCTCVDERLLN